MVVSWQSGRNTVTTRHTTVTGRGLPQVAKIRHRTRTCGTRVPKTAGLPVPVLFPNYGISPSQHEEGKKATQGLHLFTGRNVGLAGVQGSVPGPNNKGKMYGVCSGSHTAWNLQLLD